MAEQSQQQQLLFDLLSKLAPQHCTASVNPYTTSTVNASKEHASSAVYAANTEDLMKEYNHVSELHAVEGTLLLQGCQHTSNTSNSPTNFTPLNGDYSATNSLQITPICQISQDSLGVLTSSSHLKGIDTISPHHSSVSVAAAPQQSSLDIDSELVQVLRQKKSKALEANSNAADGQPFSGPTHGSLSCVRNGCLKPSSGPLVKKNNNFNGVLPTIFEVENDFFLEPNSNSSNPPCQNHIPQTLPTGNKGKFNKGRDASGLHSSSGQQPTAKYNLNQHKTPGNMSTQLDTNVAKASHAPQLTISTTSHIEPVVTSEQVEPTSALNVHQSSPSTSELPLSNTIVYTASSLTSLEPFNFVPSNSLDTIVPETHDLFQTQLGSQPPKQKLDNKQLPTDTQEP
ncbi:hypothetical protein LguiA_001790 [Lonicera macranthoides]